MHKDYINFRLQKKKISQNTVIHEVRLIKSLINFINKKYDKTVNYYEIRPIDIKEFLNKEKKSGLKNSTVKKKLTYIKVWFDYLWETNQIQYDFMTKFKYEIDTDPIEKFEINYDELLTLQSKYLKDYNKPLNSKLLYLLYMRGIRVRDIIELKTNHFHDNRKKITLKYKTKSGYWMEQNFTKDEEIAVILAAIEEATFRGVNYILSSKSNEGLFTRFQLGSLNYYITILNEYTGILFKSEQIRYAYVHHLYKTENIPVEEIQGMIGTSLDTATSILKETLERIDVIDYN